MIREILAYKSESKLMFDPFLFLLVTFRSAMLCLRAWKFNYKLRVLMSRSKWKLWGKNEKNEASNATFCDRVENVISLICRFGCLLRYTVEFMGLYDMIILLCGLKVEESVIFGNGPNRVDRPHLICKKWNYTPRYTPEMKLCSCIFCMF